MSAIPAGVRRAVLARADGRCERCGLYTDALELHHRKFRGRGGKHTMENLAALCGWGNHTGCHGFAHSEDPAAYAEGWAVHSWGDERVTAVLYRGEFRVLRVA